MIPGFPGIGPDTKPTRNCKHVFTVCNCIGPRPGWPLARKTERTPGQEFTYAYEYDQTGRLTKVLRDGMLSEIYVYDVEGRRWSETNAFRRLYDRRMRYGVGNRLLACGQAGYVHGESGFREARQGPDGEAHYYYAGDGRMLGADTEDGRQIAFRHDQADRRVRKLVNGKTVEEYEWLDRIRLGAAIIEGLQMQFHYEQARVPVAATIGDTLVHLFYDQVGSLRVVADGYGNVIQEIVYDSFGNVLENTNPGLRIPIGFAGGLHDPDTGFVRLGFRDYDPDTGRFTALDPIGPLGGDPDEYGYCLDDPVNAIDPEGLAAGDWWDIPANIKQNYDKAMQIAGEESAKRPKAHNDAEDAMRHAEWNRRMVEEIGPFTAWSAGVGHEAVNLLDGSPMGEIWMDLKNNAEGRKAAYEKRSVDQKSLRTSPGQRSKINPYRNDPYEVEEYLD